MSGRITKLQNAKDVGYKESAEGNEWILNGNKLR